MKGNYFSDRGFLFTLLLSWLPLPTRLLHEHLPGMLVETELSSFADPVKYIK